MNITNSFFGIPLTWEDIVDRNIIWRVDKNIDADFKIPNADRFNSSDIRV
jgi:hypothetical protein